MNLPMADLAWDEEMLTISLQNIKPSVSYREAQIEENGQLAMRANIPDPLIFNQNGASAVHLEAQTHMYNTHFYTAPLNLFTVSLSCSQIHTHTNIQIKIQFTCGHFQYQKQEKLYL